MVLVMRTLLVTVIGRSPLKPDASRRFEAVVAAVLAYRFYVAAA
jgi:hypothetical protein